MAFCHKTRSRFWQGFWQVADPKIWIASTIPLAIGSTLAYAAAGSFNWPLLLLGALALYLLETGKNAINEFIDYRSGVDRFVTPDKRTPFSGGKKTIIDGKLTLKENLFIGIATVALGCFIGLYIVLFHQFQIIWVGLAGVFFALFYSLPPFSFAYRGLGEIVVGLTFGPLITAGAYILQRGSLDLLPLAASLPLGLLIANVLWINQYPDYEADRQGGKMNGVVRLGKEKGLTVYALLFLLAYLTLSLPGLVSGSPLWLLPLVSLPLAIRAVNIAREHFDNIPSLIEANARTIQIYLLTGLSMLPAILLPTMRG